MAKFESNWEIQEGMTHIVVGAVIPRHDDSLVTVASLEDEKRR
jgi:hypothetical protein